jgi:hypothetical protein
MNTKLIADMTTAEMVAEYNLLTGKSIKKFSSRAAGEQQLTKARELAQQTATVAVQPAAQPKEDEVTEETKGYRYDVDGCPNCKATEDQTYAGQEGTTAEERNFCHHCGTEYWRDTGEIYKAPAKSDTRSKAIAATWENDKIAAARSARDNVSVEGKGTFRSVAAAFKQLGLPMSKHIKFRIEVKANGTGTFKYGEDEYEFRVVNKQDELPV